MLIAYIRISDDDRGSTKSPDHQRQQITAYCAATGLTVGEWIEDVGYSGRNESRPGWQRALALLASGKAAGLVATDLSRLHRRARHALAFAEDYIVKRSLRLVLLREQVDLGTASGRFQYTVLVAANQFHADVTSDKVKAWAAAKRSRGEKTGGAVPYGYKAVGSKLVPQATEQDAVAFMLACHAQGLGASATASQLTAAGYRTRTGLGWDPTQVRRVLARARRTDGGAKVG